jgi:OsmC-like protein.
VRETVSVTIAQIENYRFTVDFGAELQHLDRLLNQFENFCTVSQSVQTGVPIAVRVEDDAGAVLK